MLCCLLPILALNDAAQSVVGIHNYWLMSLVSFWDLLSMRSAYSV